MAPSEQDRQTELENIAWKKLKEQIDESKIEEAIRGSFNGDINSEDLKALIEIQKKITLEAAQSLAKQLNEKLDVYNFSLNRLNAAVFVEDPDDRVPGRRGPKIPIVSYVDRRFNNFARTFGGAKTMLYVLISVLTLIVSIIALVK